MLRLGKLEVSGGFLLVCAALFYLDNQGIFPWAMLACALHELGHCAAIKAVGGRVLRLRMTAVGGELALTGRPLSYGRELAAVLAGPGANFAAAVLAAAPGRAAGEGLLLFAGLNFAIGLFNLLPIYPLDGGRAVGLLASLLWSPQAADEVGRALNCLLVPLLAAAGGYLLWRTRYNFTILLISGWLLCAALKKGGRRLRRPGCGA